MNRDSSLLFKTLCWLRLCKPLQESEIAATGLWDKMPGDSEADSLDTIFELSRNASLQLSSDSDAVDSKTLAVLGLGSVIIGLLATQANTSLRWPWDGLAWVVGLALSTYVLLLLTAVAVIKERDWHGNPSPESLIRDYAHLSPRQAKKWLLEYAVDDYRRNARNLHFKSCGLRLSIRLFTLEMALVVAWGVWSSVQ